VGASLSREVIARFGGLDFLDFRVPKGHHALACPTGFGSSSIEALSRTVLSRGKAYSGDDDIVKVEDFTDGDVLQKTNMHYQSYYIVSDDRRVLVFFDLYDDAAILMFDAELTKRIGQVLVIGELVDAARAEVETLKQKPEWAAAARKWQHFLQHAPGQAAQP
jgi:hypothetical protein